jgi:hypothetical protein
MYHTTGITKTQIAELCAEIEAHELNQECADGHRFWDYPTRSQQR